MVFEYIKRGWEVYKENLVSFIAAELILLLFVGLFGGVALWFIFSSLGISPLTELTDPTILIERIGSIFPLLLRLSFVFFLFLTGGLIDAFLKTGMYGMADEAFRGNTELNTLFIIAREKGLRGLSSSIILGMIFFVMMVILVGGLGTIFSLIGSLIGLILSFLIMIFFSLTFPALVVDDLSATEAIKQSFKLSLIHI